MGSLQDALPQPVPPDVEHKLLEIIVQKMRGPVALYVGAVRAVEAVYGPEARQVIRDGQWASLSKHASQVGDNSLRAFCAGLEAACRGSHEWEKLEDTDVRQAYRFTRCAWAEIFRALDAADIGYWICEGDGPAAAAFNPRIRFQRTKTLMEGADCCDHVYFIDDGSGEPA